MLRYGFIWLVSLAAALTSAVVAMGAITSDKVPDLAINLYPTNGFAAEKLASGSAREAIAENGGEFPDIVDSDTIKLAQQAFISEPVTPDAISILALGSTSQIRRKLMGEAQALSRRQALVVAWLIADSGKRKDISALLGHYDTMLRTNRRAASVILPLMSQALTNEDALAPFAQLLETKPPWSRRFWGAAISNKESIGNAARLRELLHKPDDDDEEVYQDARMVRGLVLTERFGKAKSMYHLLSGEKPKVGTLVNNGFFDREPRFPPLDWQLYSTGEYGAVVSDGKLKLSAIRNASGLFARQLVELPQRIVTLDIKTGSPIPDDAELIFSLECAQTLENSPRSIRLPQKEEITNLQIDNSGSGCTYYWLGINGRASENGNGFDVSVDSVSIALG